MRNLSPFYPFAILLMVGIWANNCVNAQIISTNAGNGTAGYSGDGGPATAAKMYQPYGLAVDGGGNIYVSEWGNDCIRKITPSGTITTFAGTGTDGYSGDGGPATAAKLSNPCGLAVDGGGNLYIADEGNSRVRKITPSGIISTFAGNGNSGFSGDGGPATAAKLNEPRGVALDGSGNVFIADNFNRRIRKVAPSGTISTIAGNGTSGYSGDGGPATAAKILDAHDVAVDGSGNVYIANFSNNRIRRVTPSGIITTIAGDGYGAFSGDGGAATAAELQCPNGIVIDGSGDLYISDAGNNRIRKLSMPTGIINTIAGNGTSGYSGDGGPATAAEFHFLSHLAIDSNRNIYVADGFNNRIRKISSCTLPLAPNIAGVDSLCPGNTSTFTNAFHGGIWLSADSSIATVNSSGTVTSLAAGTVNILYIVTTTCGSDTAVFPLVVKGMVDCPDAVKGIDNEEGNALTIYPNPNDGKFTIAGNINGTGELAFEVRDVIGRVVKMGAGAVINGKFKVAVQFDRALNEGYYYVRIFAGGVVLARSFVVVR